MLPTLHTTTQKRITLLIYSALIVTLIISILEYTNTQTHEEQHQEIMTRYGCTNTTITNNIFTGTTTCHHYKPRTQQTKETELYLHTLHHIQTRNNQPITTLLYILIFLTFIHTLKKTK